MNVSCRACEACEGVRNHHNRTLRTAPYRARRRGVRAISLWDRTSHARRTARTIKMEIESGWSPCRSGSFPAKKYAGGGAEPPFSRVFGDLYGVVWNGSAPVGTGRHRLALVAQQVFRREVIDARRLAFAFLQRERDAESQNFARSQRRAAFAVRIVHEQHEARGQARRDFKAHHVISHARSMAPVRSDRDEDQVMDVQPKAIRAAAIAPRRVRGSTPRAIRQTSTARASQTVVMGPSRTGRGKRPSRT
jgi:hypothetical protein